MAEKLDTSVFNTLNLGIQDTEIIGDYETMEAFLSDVPLEKKKEDEETKKKEEEEKLKAEKEKPADPLEDLQETEEEKKEKEEEEKPKEGEEQDGFDYAAFGKDLFRIGILTEMEDEEEIKTPDDLLARLNYEKQMGATNWLEGYLSKFGDDRKEMFEAIFVNGVDPKEYLPAFNKVQDFENMDITVEGSQKEIFREFYRRVGMDESTIEKKLQKSIDYGDLENDSKEFHPKLVAQDKKKLQDMTEASRIKEESQKRADGEYKANIQKKLVDAVQKRELSGIPITQQKANEVFDFLYTTKYKTNDGKLLTEFDKFILESKKPENLEQRIILSLLKLDNFDFSKIEKNGVSKESKSLFSDLVHKQVKSKTREISKSVPSGGWSQL